MKTSIAIIFKNGWIYGLIMAAISIVFSLLMYIFDVNLFSITFAIFSALIFLLGIPITLAILGCNNLRSKYAEDRTISYLDAVFTCLVIFVIGFILSNLYNYVFNTYLDPSYMKQQLVKLVEMLEKYNLPQEQIDETIAKSEESFNLGIMFRNSAGVAVVLSLILAIFVKKKDKLEDNIL